MPNSTCGVFTLRVNILLKLFLQEICITEMRFFLVVYTVKSLMSLMIINECK
jgi:hypothetical protein